MRLPRGGRGRIKAAPPTVVNDPGDQDGRELSGTAVRMLLHVVLGALLFVLLLEAVLQLIFR